MSRPVLLARPADVHLVDVRQSSASLGQPSMPSAEKGQGTSNIQIAAAHRPTNQKIESQNNQSSRFIGGRPRHPEGAGAGACDKTEISLLPISIRRTVAPLAKSRQPGRCYHAPMIWDLGSSRMSDAV